MELKIYNPIVDDMTREWLFDGKGTSFKSIDDFIASIPEDDEAIDMLIHCDGGSVSEGWAIIDKLRATGKTITATVEGTCASMAVSLLLAASVRKASRHASFLIHNPYIPGYYTDQMNVQEAEKLQEDLAKETERMLDWYVERTGADKETLRDLMNKETTLTAEEAKELGFIAEIIADKSAQKTNNMSKNTTIASAFAALGRALGLTTDVPEPQVVSLSITTEEGIELTVERESGDPQVGDAATPDGEFTTSEGYKIVVEGGFIVSIDKIEEPAPQPEEEPETDEKDQQIADLNAQVEALQAQIAELQQSQTTDEQKAILNSVAQAGGQEWLARVTASNYQPTPRAFEGNQGADADIFAEKKAAMREKFNKKR